MIAAIIIVYQFKNINAVHTGLTGLVFVHWCGIPYKSIYFITASILLLLCLVYIFKYIMAVHTGLTGLVIVYCLLYLFPFCHGRNIHLLNRNLDFDKQETFAMLVIWVKLKELLGSC